MDDEDTSSNPRRTWSDEDRTLTSVREIHGFYSYSMAAEVFAVVGVGAFLPVTLEQLARENGVLYSDRTTPCMSAAGAAGRLAVRATDGARDADQCLVHLFGTDVTTASFAMYTFSVAVLCQALTLVSVSAFADYGGNRKRLLLTFGTIGAIMSMSFMFVVPAIYLVGALLVIIGVTCLGSSFVVLNSFLPLLAANHPSVQDTSKKGRTGVGETIPADGCSTELQISTTISSNAVGLGYAAAVFVQVLGIGILAITKKLFGDSISSTLPLRLILLLAGLWWLAFMVPTAMWLRKRPGPPLQDARLTQHGSKFMIAVTYVRFAWSSLWRTVKIAAQLKQMVIFLVAWFLLSDAQASVSGTAVLFARTELKIGTIGIALLSITVMVSGILGAVLIPMLSRRMHWTSTQTIVACLALMEVVPLYGLMGYLPFVRSWSVGGLQQWWEIYPLGFIFGFVMAGLSSFCRSCFGQLIPPENEAAFFALFAITDKGSSAVGPAIVGKIVDTTGHIRPAFWFIAVLIALPTPLIWYTDVARGQEDGRRMAVRLKEQQGLTLQMRTAAENEEVEALMRDED